MPSPRRGRRRKLLGLLASSLVVRGDDAEACADGKVDLSVFLCCASVRDRDKAPGDGRSDPYCRISAASCVVRDPVRRRVPLVSRPGA